jgi:hypothetical protein
MSFWECFWHPHLIHKTFRSREKNWLCAVIICEEAREVLVFVVIWQGDFNHRTVRQKRADNVTISYIWNKKKRLCIIVILHMVIYLYDFRFKICNLVVFIQSVSYTVLFHVVICKGLFVRYRCILDGCIFVHTISFEERRAYCFAAICWSVDLSIHQQFPFIFFTLVAHHEMKFGTVYRFIIRISSSYYVLSTIEQFTTELCPLDFEKFQ